MIKIFAIERETGERIEIDDLYWFEENGVHDFEGEGTTGYYSFEIFVNDIKVYPTET